jgi:hypothetical protein
LKTAPKLLLLILTLLLPVLLLQPWRPGLSAQAEDAPQQALRKNTQTVLFTWYDWWMVHWENNEAVCRILIEHPGLPNGAEILNACGTTYYNQWAATQPCNSLADTTTCQGMYLHFLRSFPGKRNVEVTLPEPQVWLSLVNCNPSPTPNVCTSVPTLLLTGEEPLPNEMIIDIKGTLDGQPFNCPGNICTLPLQPTGTQGISMEFWGDSSHGDSTLIFKALIRVVPQGDFMAPEGNVQVDNARWTVDVLSSQWRDSPLASCSDTWQVFPDPNGPPAWLNTPVQLSDMLSTYSYYYLAGVLIENGLVDVADCPSGGLADNKTANECGLQRALPQVKEWQNRFDEQILQVAKDTGVPAQLMKNVFGRESQFWPGLYSTVNEAGLGQLTEKGADTLLVWNTDFFTQYCPTVLSSDTCQKGFVFLKPEEQNMLRGSLMGQVNASCPQCPLHVDLNQAAFSVRIFAQSMLANCQQTARIVFNITNRSPGQVSSYVDLWKMTLANYNAGPGCLYTAAQAAWSLDKSLAWDAIKGYLEPACQPASDYVDSISQGQPAEPTPTPWVFQGTALPSPIYPTAPPTPIASPTFQARPTRGATGQPTLVPTITPANPTSTPGGPTPTQTATQPGYPAGSPTATPPPYQ